MQVMSDSSLAFANVREQLYGNHAKNLPWFSDDDDDF